MIYVPSRPELWRKWCKGVRELIGPAWVEDLKYQTEKDSARGLAWLFHPEQFREIDRVVTYPNNYGRFARGVSLPGQPRVDHIVDLYPLGDRVLRLILWYVLHQTTSSPPDLGVVARHTEPKVGTLCRQAIDVAYQAPYVRARCLDRILGRLRRIATPDALAAVLALEAEPSFTDPAVHSKLSLYLTAWSILLRFAAFPPFNSCYERLYRYLGTAFYPPQKHVCKHLNETVPWLNRHVATMRQGLKLVLPLGVLGDRYRQQMRFAYRYLCLREADRQDIDAALAAIHENPAPVKVRPTDPLYRLLRASRLPATRIGAPLTVLKRQSRKPTKLANSLDTINESIRTSYPVSNSRFQMHRYQNYPQSAISAL